MQENLQEMILDYFYLPSSTIIPKFIERKGGNNVREIDDLRISAGKVR